MKVIEVNTAKEFASTFFGDPILKMAVNAAIDNAPTVDAVPVDDIRVHLSKVYIEANEFVLHICICGKQ